MGGAGIKQFSTSVKAKKRVPKNEATRKKLAEVLTAQSADLVKGDAATNKPEKKTKEQKARCAHATHACTHTHNFV